MNIERSTKDPIVNKVREIRHEFERKFENDADGFYEWLLDLQHKYDKRIIRRRPKPLPTKRVSEKLSNNPVGVKYV